ncbi:hypothetical protein SAMN04487775_102356 [Treponema bryantii]|uniref:Uncharacterized protein n=1 Tax=Treponema bryantii TaxID=163 RepID=A0A1I3J5X0_9SPIR|nr:hypothetical protein [Treponema bryantii]SFI55579.1 hypothetical protein SAMN04487775_102356 [Treponema bryantii]
MKALLISDRKEIIDFVAPLLKQKGFDLIHYRWIIKALDNIEEIQPDVIVLSSIEYPRHWKTLAGFVQSGIGGNDVKMYLYDTEPLSQEDSKKATDLGILSFEDSFNAPEPVDVQLAINNQDGKIKLFNAKFDADKNCVQFNFEDNDFKNGLMKYVSMFDGKNVSAFSADFSKVDEHNAYLIIKDYYEKKI